MNRIFIIMLAALTLAGCGDKEKPVKTYTVTFDAAGGSPTPPKQTVEAGGTATAPQTNPAKQDYVFLYWSLSGTTTAYNFQTPVNSNITLAANWQRAEEAQLELLYFNDNTISPIESFSFFDDGEGGWWDELPFIVRTNQPAWEATSDQTWCIVERNDASDIDFPEDEEGFFIYFEPNTGDFDREVTITVTAGNAEPVTFSMTQKGKLGRYFGTWRVTWSFEGDVAFWEQITISADKIEWLNKNGNYFIITNLTWTESINPGGDYTDNYPNGFRVTGTLTAKNGYNNIHKLDGSGEAAVGDIVLISYYIYIGNGSIRAGNLQTAEQEALYGPYMMKTDVEYWQVAWELNGGEWLADDNHATQVAKDGKLAASNYPAKIYEIFQGWYSDAALTNAVSFPYDVSSLTGDLTLYAKWEEYDPGGTGPLNIAFVARSPATVYLYDNEIFCGSRINYDLIVYDAEGMSSILITEIVTRPGDAMTDAIIRVIPISGPGTYHLSQEMVNSNPAYAQTTQFTYTVRAGGKSYTTPYTGNYSSFDSSWSHNFSFRTPALRLDQKDYLPEGIEGRFYSVNLNAGESGGAGAGLGEANIRCELVSGSLPAGLTLSSDGRLNGTPAAGSEGTRSFTVQASAEGYESITKYFTLQIHPDGSTPTLPADKISGGSFHALAIDGGGNLWAWGRNVTGQLGDGTTVNRYFPVPITEGVKYTEIAAGYSHSLAIDTDNNLWAWGNNLDGQLGDGSTTSHLSPVQIKDGTKFTTIAACSYHSFAIDDAGNLWAWGDNFNGLLGDGTTTKRLSPVQIKEGTKFTAIAAGNNHSLAIDADGNLWAWGYNSDGQLGDGTTTSLLSPTQIKEGTKFTAVVAGLYHSLAIDDDSNLWAWGHNGAGQIGDGTNTRRLSPVLIKAGTKFTAVKAGYTHSLAVDSYNKIWVWGNNSIGQIGDGNAGTNRNIPKQIKIESNFTTIAAGRFYSFAIDTSGILWAWGDNSYGQLGDGTTFDASFPQMIFPY